MRPRHRSKEIAYLSLTHFVKPLDGSVEVYCRFHHDSFGIYANTVWWLRGSKSLANILFSHPPFASISKLRPAFMSRACLPMWKIPACFDWSAFDFRICIRPAHVLFGGLPAFLFLSRLPMGSAPLGKSISMCILMRPFSVMTCGARTGPLLPCSIPRPTSLILGSGYGFKTNNIGERAGNPAGWRSGSSPIFFHPAKRIQPTGKIKALLKSPKPKP